MALCAVLTDERCTVCLLTAPSRISQDDKVIWCSLYCFFFEATLFHLDLDVNVGSAGFNIFVSGAVMHADLFHLSFTSRVLCMISHFSSAV